MRPEIAFERSDQASESPELAPWKPKRASERLQTRARGGDGGTDGRTYVQIPPVFYRTSSPFGAEAQKGNGMRSFPF